MCAPWAYGRLVGRLAAPRGRPAGEVSPAAALDALSSGGGAVLLDIRTAREKEAAGLPDLPGGSGKLVEVEYASIADRKLRGQLRNAGDLELKVGGAGWRFR